MDLDQLTTFDRIVRDGSFSRAAWALGIAQPTVSARLSALEREVGGRLFTRERVVHLTERGVSFLPYAQRALATLQDGLEASRLAAVGERGRLAVGALRSLSGYFLAPLVARYYGQYPDVECLVCEGRHAEVVEQLCDGVIELALICWPPQDPLLADLTPLLHLREEVVPIVSCRHTLAGRPEVSRSELLAYSRPFLLLRWWQTTPPALAQLVAQATAVAEVPTDTGRFLLSSGVGTGYFPSMVIAPDLATGTVVQLRPGGLPALWRDTALVHLSRRPQLSAAAQAFAGMVREEASRVGLLQPGE